VAQATAKKSDLLTKMHSNFQVSIHCSHTHSCSLSLFIKWRFTDIWPLITEIGDFEMVMMSNLLSKLL